MSLRVLNMNLFLKHIFNENMRIILIDLSTKFLPSAGFISFEMTILPNSTFYILYSRILWDKAVFHLYNSSFNILHLYLITISLILRLTVSLLFHVFLSTSKIILSFGAFFNLSKYSHIQNALNSIFSQYMENFRCFCSFQI